MSDIFFYIYMYIICTYTQICIYIYIYIYKHIYIYAKSYEYCEHKPSVVRYNYIYMEISTSCIYRIYLLICPLCLCI